LWTGTICGGPVSMPSFSRIGIRVLPNLSNADCDVQTSNTDSLSLLPKQA
jgi:hypothetical protein